jgi:hypothetical protein
VAVYVVSSPYAERISSCDPGVESQHVPDGADRDAEKSGGLPVLVPGSVALEDELDVLGRELEIATE